MSYTRSIHFYFIFILLLLAPHCYCRNCSLWQNSPAITLNYFWNSPRLSDRCGPVDIGVMCSVCSILFSCLGGCPLDIVLKLLPYFNSLTQEGYMFFTAPWGLKPCGVRLWRSKDFLWMWDARALSSTLLPARIPLLKTASSPFPHSHCWYRDKHLSILSCLHSQALTDRSPLETGPIPASPALTLVDWSKCWFKLGWVFFLGGLGPRESLRVAPF